MALDPATIDAMVSAGLSAEQIAAVVKAEIVADQLKAAAAEEARKERAREGNRERQARFRQRRNASNADNAVTQRDERDPSPKDNNQTPTQPITPVDPNGSTSPEGTDSVRASVEASAPTERPEPAPRARRIPADFAESPEAQAVCAEMGLTAAETGEALAEFCDFWMSEGGAKARKLDWPRTLRNRLRDLGRRRPSARASPAPRPRASNGFFDVIREDLGEPDERSSAQQQQYPRLIAGARH